MVKKRNLFNNCKNKIDIDVKRFIELQKSWIKCVSHSMNKLQDGLAHSEREMLRDELYDYLDRRLAKECKLK